VELELPSEIASDVPTRDMLNRKLKEGYTLVSHRTSTGEETVALYRGPLVPKPDPHKSVSIQSNIRDGLRTVDPELGLLDVSYAKAWSLGKELAVGDRAFTVALVRLRKEKHRQSLETMMMDIKRGVGEHKPRDDVVEDIGKLSTNLHDKNTRRHGEEERNVHLRAEAPAALHNFQSFDLQQISITNTADFYTVLSWVLDKIFHFTGIPAHCLIPDPSHLPQERIRFFCIDDKWVDACVDGALSPGNVYASSYKEDVMKGATRRYMEERCQRRGKVPKYGFVMRSHVLAQGAVSVKFEGRVEEQGIGDESAREVLIQRQLGEDSMLWLLDCGPSELQGVKFAVPACQMEFSVDSLTDEEEMPVAFKSMNTELNE
jgi:hypothetical protein